MVKDSDIELVNVMHRQIESYRKENLELIRSNSILTDDKMHLLKENDRLLKQVEELRLELLNILNELRQSICRGGM